MGVSALARRFQIDVSADGSSWLQLVGVTDFNPQVAPNKQDSATYDSDGWGSSEITMNAWSVQVKMLRQTTSGVFNAAQELVRARVAQFGDDARIFVRWYDNTGAPEAHTGRGIVEWSRSKTGVTDLDEVQVTVTGDGALVDIANPYAANSVPMLVSATPSGAAAGALVEIQGQGFTGTTGLKFAAVSVATYKVLSDNVIMAVMPAGTAGSAALVVTNATGASAAMPYTRA